MAGCDDCFFGGKQVGYWGDFASPFVIVGESPGVMELAKDKPFVGPPGDLLRQVLAPHMDALAEAGIEPLKMNAINCLPRQKDPNKLAQACQRCNGRLMCEIKAHPRKVILALGNAALWSTTGKYSLKITQVRGTVYDSELAEKGIVATVHPSFLLRGGGNLQQFKRDVALAVELVTGSKTGLAANTGKITVSGQFKPGAYKVLTTAEEVAVVVAELKSGKYKYAAGDIETDGFDPRAKNPNPPSFMGVGILSIGICYHKDMTYVIPGNLITDELFDNEVEWCWHNGKYDIGWLREYGYEHARVDDDTMLMSYLLNEKGGVHDLEQVGGDWLQAPNYKDMLDKHLPTKKHSYAHIPKDVLYKYQAIDTNLTFCLRDVLRDRIMADANLKRVYTRILIPGSEFIHMVERRGFRVDLEKVALNEERLSTEAERANRAFCLLAEQVSSEFLGINIQSPIQVAKLLYNTLKLGPVGWSTDVDTLDKLPPHPIVKALKEYRKVQKQLSTFVIPIRTRMALDGRMHTTFKLHGTTTGRLSSNKPNMQNIPRDKNIRGQFIASPGYAILEVDLAQAELRMLACLSRDKAMIDIFNAGVSLHDEVAEYLFGKGFNKEQKMIAKNINFGIVYGISAHGLQDQVEIGAKQLGSAMHVSKKEAEKWIHGWYDRFPGAATFIRKCRDAPIKGQSLVSFTGRKRRFGVVGVERLNNLQNEAANFPHQSGAHDITLMAGIELAPEFDIDYNTGVVNEVHDSLVHDTPDDMSTIVPIAIRAMQTLERIPREWGLIEVPFKAEAEIGYAWGNGVAFDPYQYLDQLEQLKGVSHAQVIKAQNK